MSKNDAPQSLAELDQWAACVETMELAGGKAPGKDTLAARGAFLRAARAEGETA